MNGILTNGDIPEALRRYGCVPSWERPNLPVATIRTRSIADGPTRPRALVESIRL
ncbi:hypothetical protein GCM10010222_60120 [Streptomyces tanashiensis]|nr:hypothetical protein GCM10010222_60120 [Streptomyces tanashiensis]